MRMRRGRSISGRGCSPPRERHHEDLINLAVTIDQSRRRSVGAQRSEHSECSIHDCVR